MRMKECNKLNTVCNETERNKLKVFGISETNCSDIGSFRTISKTTVIFAVKEDHYSHGAALIPTKEIQIQGKPQYQLKLIIYINYCK